MRAADLEKTMGELGRIYLLGLFIHFTIDGRPVLLPFFAAGCLSYLRQLASYRAMRASRWFATTVICAGVVVAGCIAAWIPFVDLGASLWAVGIAMAVGPAAYAGSLHDWSVTQGWTPPAAVARVAQRWLFGVVAVLAMGIVAIVVTVDPGPVGSDPRYSPSSVLGRPLEGWWPGVVFIVAAVGLIVGMLKLRKASQLIRHSLRAQPDAELVEV